MNDIQALKLAVDKLHGRRAAYVETVPVLERFKGKVVWDGKVEVFDLAGNAQSSRCFAWHHRKYDGSRRTRIVAILTVPPITSRQAAVKADIVGDFNGERAN